MSYCINCGTQIPEGSKFCPNCGTPVPGAEVETNKQEAPPTDRPASATPVQTVAPTQPSSSSAPAMNMQFLSNAGWWGAVIMLVSFFLPYYMSIIGEMSMSDIVFGSGEKSGGIYLLLVFPVSAVIIIIQGLFGVFPSFVSNIFKVLPLLLLVLCIGAYLKENSSEYSFQVMMATARIGFYGLLLGTFLILFFRRKK